MDDRKIYDLKIDEEFRAFCPAISEGEYAELERRILDEGIRDSLVVWNGTVIDGHNRYSIARKHGIPFSIKEIEFKSRNDALTWIGDNALGRRNMDKLDKCLLVLKMEPYYSKKAGENQGRRTDLVLNLGRGSQRATHIMAEKAGVSHAQLEKIKAILQSEHEDIKAELLGRETSVHGAYTKLREREKGDKEGQHEAESPEYFDGEKSEGEYDVILDGLNEDDDFPGSDKTEDSAQPMANEDKTGCHRRSGEEETRPCKKPKTEEDEAEDVGIVGKKPLPEGFKAAKSLSEMPGSELPDSLEGNGSQETKELIMFDTNVISFGGIPADDPELRVKGESVFVTNKIRELTEYYSRQFAEFMKYLYGLPVKKETMEMLEKMDRKAHEAAMNALGKLRREEVVVIVDEDGTVSDVTE